MDRVTTVSQPMVITPLSGEIIRSENYWNQVIEAKRDFLERDISPLENSLLRKEIARSWLQSRELGVDPYINRSRRCILPEAEFKRIKEENRELIDIVAPMSKTFANVVRDSGYIFTLFCKEGVVLLKAGNDELFHHFNLQVGDLYSDYSVGTCAHTLSLRNGYAAQLIGPENWQIIMHKTLCASSPIISSRGDIIGALVLVVLLEDEPWKSDFQNIHGHTLGWLCSMAVAVSGQLELRERCREVTTLNQSLENYSKITTTTLDFIDEAIIYVDHNGNFIHVNTEARKMLKIERDRISSYNLMDFIKCRESVRKLTTCMSKVDYAEATLKVGDKEYTYFISARPVENTSDPHLCSVVLRLNSAEKLNALVSNRLGTTSQFTFDDLIGESPLFTQACTMAKHFAAIPENILLQGESGTGKELFAQAIHNAGNLPGAFIAVNCSALPRELIESELFGYASGAFTGAQKEGRAGKIELADKGTLFLDEIGDMPIELQSVLLRVLQDKQVLRVGGSSYRQVDFRLIAATNKNLSDLIEKGFFREDLFFRLAVFIVNIPPLRNRGDDKLLLAEYFLERYSRRMGWEIPTINAQAKAFIAKFTWPGNVRQLENTIVYVVNMLRITEETVINASHFSDVLMSSYNEKSSVSLPDKAAPKKPSAAWNAVQGELDEVISLKESERIALLNAMRLAKNNVADAASILGIGRTTIYRKLKEHGIDY